MATHSEIIDNIVNRDSDIAYSMVFHTSSPFSRGGENFTTVILDCESYNPIFIYTWINLYED